jgi:hypothetical protein
MDETTQRQKNLQSQLQKALLTLKNDLQQHSGHATNVSFSLQEIVHANQRSALLTETTTVADAKQFEYQHDRLEALSSLLKQRDFADGNLPGLIAEVGLTASNSCWQLVASCYLVVVVQRSLGPQLQRVTTRSHPAMASRSGQETCAIPCGIDTAVG